MRASGRGKKPDREESKYKTKQTNITLNVRTEARGQS